MVRMRNLNQRTTQRALSLLRLHKVGQVRSESERGSKHPANRSQESIPISKIEAWARCLQVAPSSFSMNDDDSLLPPWPLPAHSEAEDGLSSSPLDNVFHEVGHPSREPECLPLTSQARSSNSPQEQKRPNGWWRIAAGSRTNFEPSSQDHPRPHDREGSRFAIYSRDPNSTPCGV